jgi:hypothetical protein
VTEQKSGRWSHLRPDVTDLPSDQFLKSMLPTVTLRCLDEVSAQRVVNEFPNRDRGGQTNTMKLDGGTVVITYADKRWPYDIADWAGEMGLASDSDSARVIACL